jgi:hypothetical protein
MTDRFLKAKHWQLFVLTFGVPMIFQIFMMISLFSNFAIDTPPDPAFMLKYLIYLPFIMIIVLGIQFGWMWSVGVGLQNKVPVAVKMNVKTFKIFLFIPIVYFFIIAAFMGMVMNGIFSRNELPFEQIGSLFFLIIPFHLLSMFSMFYGLYFIAKTLKTVETQREASFSDFAGEFFMIWFYPVGIWIVQPRINKLAAA